ncbi:MAG: S8/S53 family peptidase [Solirubrobacterales bacterium]|nr:S8/S53 family peptidase [Solirubrobacterales bacterium]
MLPLAANTSGLERFASQVSTPGSRDYRHFQSLGALAKRFGASAKTRTKVVSYLRSHGASSVRTDKTGLFIDAKMSTADAARVFGTSLRTGRSAHAVFEEPSSQVRIPAALSGAVTGVVGLNTEPIATRHEVRRAAAHSTPAAGSAYLPASGTPAGCAKGQAAGGFTPKQYRDAYGLSALSAKGLSGQGEKVALIEIDGFRASDISTFGKCFGIRVPKITGYTVGSGISSGGLTPGGEAALDLEVLASAAPGLSGIDVYETQPDPASVLEALTAPLQNPGHKPQVISASLGLCEPQTIAPPVGKGGLKDADAALAEAAASGISVVAASGDDGSADCVNGDQATAPPEARTAVNYPSSSPWVTAVGGTNIHLNAANQIISQTVWNDANQDPSTVGAGGGGYSGVEKRPGYQNGVNSNSHRELPDVSLLGDVAPGFDVYCTADSGPDPCYSPSQPQQCNAAAGTPNCVWQPIGGTSASTPLMAGSIAVIDQLQRRNHKQDVGLFNPLLYKLGKTRANDSGKIFQDVTSGSNDVGPYIPGNGGHALGCCSAAPGFDAASGWGGINLAGLSKASLDAAKSLVRVSESIPRGQRPVSKGYVTARVGCSGACDLGAIAKVTIKGKKPFSQHSGVYTLKKRGAKTAKVSFTRAERSALSAALKRHTPITVSVYGAIVDVAGNVESLTKARTFRASS